MTSVYAGASAGTDVDASCSMNPDRFDDEHVTTSPKETLSPEEIATNRTGMVLLHFFVAYPKWSLSIFLFLASLSVPLMPSMSVAARLPMERLQGIVKEESKAYYECTLQAFDFLDEEMTSTANQEYQQVLKRRTSNQIMLHELTEFDTKCSKAGLEAREALLIWSNETWTLPFVNQSNNVDLENKTICTVEDREFISTSLGQDFQEMEAKVGSVMDGYVESSESSLTLVSNYAKERMDYDYNYFLRERIEPAIKYLQELVDNPDFSMIFFSIQPQDILNDLLISLEGLKDTIEEAKARIAILMERLQEFHASIVQFHLHYSDLYIKCLEFQQYWIDFKAAVILPSVDIPSFIEMDGFPIPDSLLPPRFYIPEFQPELADLALLLDEFSSEAFEIIENLIETLAQAAATALRATINEISKHLLELLQLEDYNPPLFKGSHPQVSTMSEELDYLTELGTAAKTAALKSLQEIQRWTNTTSIGGPDIPKLDATNYSFSENTTTFDYQNPLFPTIAIPELLEAIIIGILSYQWLIEMVVQSIRLWRLKVRYERDAIPDMPKINFGGDEDKDSDDKMAACANLAATLIKNFVTPWIFIFLIALPLGLMGICTWYPHVQANCIQTKNGTVIANNVLLPLLVNEASAPGNLLHTRREFDCRRRQRLICNRMYAESDLIHTEDATTYSSLMHKFNQSVEWNERLGRCIDTDRLDDEFAEACCGLEWYSGNDCELDPQDRPFACPINNKITPPGAFRPLSHYISDPSCNSDSALWDLEDARFDCNALEDSCSLTPCIGVDEEFIRAMVIEADCKIETYLIDCIMFVMLALYHAVMLNFFLTLIFNGLKCLLWPKLRPDFPFETLLNQDGELVRGEKESERKDLVDIAKKKLEIQGWIQLIFGICLFIFWIVSFFLVQDFIENSGN